MGYSTIFKGSLQINPPLAPNHLAYLKQFVDTRRQSWKETELEGRPDPLRVAVGLPLGPRGCFYVGLPRVHGSASFFSIDQVDRSLLLDGNTPPGQMTYAERQAVADENWWMIRAVAGMENFMQPALNCDVMFNEEGTEMSLPDYMQKTYGYVAWIRYLIHHFLNPWGYTVSGAISWLGEDEDDYGAFAIYDNAVLVTKRKGEVPAPFGHFDFTSERFMSFPVQIRNSLRYVLFMTRDFPRDMRNMLVAEVLKSNVHDWPIAYDRNVPSGQGGREEN